MCRIALKPFSESAKVSGLVNALRQRSHSHRVRRFVLVVQEPGQAQDSCRVCSGWVGAELARELPLEGLGLESLTRPWLGDPAFHRERVARAIGL